MQKVGSRVVYSPSDLVTFLGSSYAAWMDRLVLERPGAATPDEPDEHLKLLARRGNEHEANVLERFRAENRNICVIDRNTDVLVETKTALASGANLIYQGALSDEAFVGYSDFLVLDELGRWEVWDAKLSRSVKPSHVLQLCCYADLLRHSVTTLVENIAVVLGNGEVVRLRHTDFHWYYRNVRDSFLDLMSRFDPNAAPPDPIPNAEYGRWETSAASWFEDRDHLVRVAGMRRSQIARFSEAGILTMKDLATATVDSVPGIGREVFPRLVRQARLQIASFGKTQPAFEILRQNAVVSRTGLALLPPSTPGDVYLDLEGFPLVDEGLEYLFGVVTSESGNLDFRDWWAHDPAGERKAFEQIVDFILERWRADRAMHVYHYGAYEVTALRRLMGKYGTREDEVDALLRGEVFVDLFSIVRQGLALGEPSYSLKNVEHLWRAPREGNVQDAAASIVEYDRWIESGESEDWRTSPILRGIREYNCADCTSTFQLAGWLRAKQVEQQIPYIPPNMGASQTEPERSLGPEAQARRDLLVTMLAESEVMADVDDESKARRRIHELFAHLVEFHRREEKPQWWALFDRAGKTHEELVQDVDGLGGLTVSGRPIPVKRSIAVSYFFDPDQETRIDEADEVRLTHDINIAASVETFDRDTGEILLKFGPKAWSALESRPPTPVSLVPFTMVNASVIQDAICAMAKLWRSASGIPRALEDFLRRRTPRIRGHIAGPLLREGEDPLAGTIRIVRDLDSSCLVIQGPPGAGKTYTAARVIVTLLKEGKKVGITSNSHKAIENLLAACNEAAGGELTFVKVGGDARSPLLEDCKGVQFCASSGDAIGSYSGGLIGGTAWLFARPEWGGVLDYLFIDEAGQVSIANLVAIAATAKNLVLLGDQMQLSQPTQGTHPVESGMSLLNYYLQGKHTIPPDLGIFLATTWRLHPELCEFISDAIYEGRLFPEAGNALRKVELPTSGGARVKKSAGIVFIPVEHDGNAQASAEEVEAIRGIVADMIGRKFTDYKGSSALTLDDFLFVAPYNMQVRRLRAALGERARVGSVDKFQGQEAPVVVLSMCASPGEFGPRGSAFLLDMHRLNVAISRAKSLAIIVGDPRIARELAGSIEEMRRLNLFCRLVRSPAQ